MEIFKWLNDGSFVKSYKVNDFRKSETTYYLNLKVLFVDDSILQVREFLDDEHRKYSFHWQTSGGNLITRWDNAPHYPEITTYPHHMHLQNGSVVESFDISLEDIFSHIHQQLK